MGTDHADKADDTEEGHAHRRDDGCGQHRHKAQRVNVDAHALRAGVAAEKDVVAPREQREYDKPRRDGGEHYCVRLVGRAAEIAEVPDDRGGQADVGSVELKYRRRRRPHRADRESREHDDVRRERAHPAQAEYQQNRQRGEDEGHQRGSVWVCPDGEVRGVVPSGEKAAGESDYREVCAEHRGVGDAER